MGCQVCRARKVKCDGRLNGCSNCARLDLACDLAHNRSNRAAALPSPGSESDRHGLGHKRTYRSCTSCRRAKTKCSGEQPACLRCRARSIPCVYNTTSAPVWTQVLLREKFRAQSGQTPGPSPGGLSDISSGAETRTHDGTTTPDYVLTQDEHRLSIRTPSVPFAMAMAPPIQPLSSGPLTVPQDAQDAQEAPEALAWLYSSQLPQTPELLHRVVDHYFSNVHPLRCFAFVHKPTFMRQLDAGYEAFATDETTLLHTICAHGAKFCALAYYSEISVQRQRPPAKLVQAAGHAWAKTAEQLLLTNYGRITVPGLMAAVLLYDYRYRLGDFAHALVMSGVVTRMAHALQLNREHSQPPHRSGAVLLPVEKEARRRLMWACYVIDTWTGSGVDQLTLLRDEDLHIQLPCDERAFLLQRPAATRMLGDADAAAAEESITGMMASYVRLVAVWKRVSRYVKHLDAARLPWRPDSEFAALDAALRAWRAGLAPYLDFSEESIYTRLESGQLGALVLLHCTYHNAVLDLYRIAVPELFSLRHAFRFPPEQAGFLRGLQARVFENACAMAGVLAAAAARGARFLADSMTPMFAYNSSRVMLYCLVRLHDPAQPNSRASVEETIRHVQSNNQVLQLASAMMRLSEPLLITAERWLQKLRCGLENDIPFGFHREGGSAASAAHTEMAASGEPPDQNDQAPATEAPRQQHDTDTPDNVLHPLSLFRLARKTLNDKAYSESPSAHASYAGGGLPPLRDTSSNTNHNDRRGWATPSPPPPPERRSSEPAFAISGTAATAPNMGAPAVTPGVTPAAAVTATPGFTGWEAAMINDLALSLQDHLQEYPQWDISGGIHSMGSGAVFDDTTGLGAWPGYGGKPP